MNEIESLKLGLQSLVTDVQALSQSVRGASASMANTSASVMGQAQQINAGAVNMAVGAVPNGMYAQRPGGFQGIPMTVPNGQMAPLNTGQSDFWSNLRYGTWNNEYNRPASWWRDTLALMGKDFVDVNKEESQKMAKRNWNYRLTMGAWEAPGLALYSVPIVGMPLGLAYDAFAAPALQAGTKRRYEYWNFLDRTGARNVDARFSSNPRGGFTDTEKSQLAAEIEGLYKGSGFTKKQSDELVQISEQAGYFKSYDKQTIDSYRRKHEQILKDAKYAMQTLHTTTEETVKVLSDISRTGGVKGSVNQINMINKAAAYTGLSPTQITEFAQGRMGTYTAMGFSETAGMQASYMELINIVRNTPSGQRPEIEKTLNIRDRFSALAKNNPILGQAIAALFVGGGSSIQIDQNVIQQAMRKGFTPADMVRIGSSKIGGFTAMQKGMLTDGTGWSALESGMKNANYSPEQIQMFEGKMAVMAAAFQFDPKGEGIGWERGKMTDDLAVRLTAMLPYSKEEILNYANNEGMLSGSIADRHTRYKKGDIKSQITNPKFGSKDPLGIKDYYTSNKLYNDIYEPWGGIAGGNKRAKAIMKISKLGGLRTLSKEGKGMLNDIQIGISEDPATAYREYNRLLLEYDKDPVKNRLSGTLANALAEKWLGREGGKYDLSVAPPMLAHKRGETIANTYIEKKFLGRAGMGSLPQGDKGMLGGIASGAVVTQMDNYRSGANNNDYLKNLRAQLTEAVNNMGTYLDIGQRYKMVNEAMEGLTVTKNAQGQLILGNETAEGSKAIMSGMQDILNNNTSALDKALDGAESSAELNVRVAEYISSQTSLNEEYLKRLGK